MNNKRIIKQFEMQPKINRHKGSKTQRRRGRRREKRFNFHGKTHQRYELRQMSWNYLIRTTIKYSNWNQRKDSGILWHLISLGWIIWKPFRPESQGILPFLPPLLIISFSYLYSSSYLHLHLHLYSYSYLPVYYLCILFVLEMIFFEMIKATHT